MKTFKVGFREGVIIDPQRRTWSGDGPRPIAWAAWYPADDAASELLTLIPAVSPLFIMGTVARDAALSEDQERFPIVLLSHGTGGTASSLGWLAQRIAAAGLIAVGVDHHGNTASEPYRPEGFLCWWERPRDLSVVLDALAEKGPFVGRIDMGRVSAAGFSLGGYTVISLSGAVTNMTLFAEWAREMPFGRGPREYPDLADHIEPLLQESSVFRASWERQSASYLDTRVNTAIALAPAPTVRAFTLDSLRTIKAPVTIMVGDADSEAPADSCSAWLHGNLPQSTLTLLGRDVGHYTLLCEGTERGKETEPAIWVDRPGVDRFSIHNRAASIALSALLQDSFRDGRRQADLPGHSRQ
ncbi:dienelactone hydrolase [Sinorhizobium garamanticum]|uniref:Dienelactone hydrolase n=1 Tax=Sinorhizobium garamanticum TaxID=680247 RepID=A0ABY8DJM0_9HYPH|nr:dienelactone hydrolase [Sinorhizobium garamanticum]WEX89882.1 dienelactone hydrolase [Sinorhizobium garamanticum]